MQRGSAASHVPSLNGHCGVSEQPSSASCAASSEASTAVSAPPCSHPQQSARVRTHWLWSVHPSSGGTAQAHERHPVASIMKPSAQVSPHPSGLHASSQLPLLQTACTLVGHDGSQLPPLQASFAGSSARIANEGHSQHVAAASTH